MIENEVDLLKYLSHQRKILHFYIKELKNRSYEEKEYQYLLGVIDNIETLISKLIYTNLKLLLVNCSNRRLKEIVSGEELLIDIISVPDDYKLIIDIDSIDDIDVTNCLVFKALNRKYCFFRHKNYGKDGLGYIQGKWQKV